MTLPLKTLTQIDRIREVLLDFRWHNYGLNDVEDSIYDGATEWADDVAKLITSRLNGVKPLDHDEVVESIDD